MDEILNLDDAIGQIRQHGGVQYHIPSIGKPLLFRSMDTGTQKMMGKIALTTDKYKSDIIRLSLFDDMLLEGKKEYKSSNLKIVDAVAFMASLKRNLTDKLVYERPCPKCGTICRTHIDLDKVIERCKAFEFQTLNVEMLDSAKKQNYNFEISDPSMMDIIILRESVFQMHDDLSDTMYETQAYYAFNKVCLYISKLSINNKEVKTKLGESFNKFPVQDRIKLFDTIDQNITISDSNPQSLLSIISERFSDAKLSKMLFDGTYGEITCSSKACGLKLEDEISYDIFFTL